MSCRDRTAVGGGGHSWIRLPVVGLQHIPWSGLPVKGEGADNETLQESLWILGDP